MTSTATVSRPHQPRRSDARCLHGALVIALALVPAANAVAKELLRGATRATDGAPLEFTISGTSRKDVIGGAITLGEHSYEITKVSRHGLIGAHRFVADGNQKYAEFAVFSSSYTDLTGVGTPWVAALVAHGCDEPYNSFLALYRVDGQEQVEKLGPTPYPQLVEDATLSRNSRVYCFIGKPPTP